MASDPHLLDKDHAPTPFTADEIRAGCPPGRTMVLRVREEGQDPYTRMITFLRCDAEGALREVTRLDPSGRPLEPPTRQRSTWLAFQGHASFPGSQTTIEKTELELPPGSYHCLLYTVREPGLVRRFWFARGLPGMPVRVVEEKDGREIYSMEMIENYFRETEAPGGPQA